MTFDEFEAELARVRAARSGVDPPEGFALFDALTATPAELDRVESGLGVTLPVLYKDFLQRVGGGSFLFLDLLPAVAAGESDEDLISVNSGPLRIPDFVAIAPVGTGDWWGFRVADANRASGEVYLWTHDDNEFLDEAVDFLEFLSAKGLRGD
ncbi:SMI1/KNR4 family protein [Nucisporomicrobium flavum]|uniref:SMI1/KNR4 family protein n=1 Tax=Nucisporomicrobium flavum TaxID=2785915 RepID=UPI003C2BBC7E